MAMSRFHSTSRGSQDEEMDADEKEARRFLLEEAKYDEEIVDGIVRALQSPHSGVPKGAMAGVICALAGRLEVGEDAGLETLAKSVEVDMKERSGKTKVSFRVKVPHANGLEFTVQGFEGESLRDVATHGRGQGTLLRARFQIPGSDTVCRTTRSRPAERIHRVCVQASYVHARGPCDAES